MSSLFKSKWIGSLKSTEVSKHKELIAKKLSNGKFITQNYSGVIKDTSLCITPAYVTNKYILELIYYYKKSNFKSGIVNFQDLLTIVF
jgi:hypothetical protein